MPAGECLRFLPESWGVCAKDAKLSCRGNSRSRLPRDQRSTTESTEIHGKENPNQLPISVSFRSTCSISLRSAPIVKTGNNHGTTPPYGRELPPGRTQKWKYIRISFPCCSVFSVVKNLSAARPRCVFRGYPFVMIFLAWVIQRWHGICSLRGLLPIIAPAATRSASPRRPPSGRGWSRGSRPGT